MYRSLLWLLVPLALSSSLLADEKTPPEEKKLQGKWQAIDIEGNGQKFPTEQIREFRVVIEGNELYAIKSKNEDPRHKFKIDPTKAPKTIDLIPLDGNRKGKSVPGIYTLQDGKLKLCINIFGKDPSRRPVDFTTQEGDGVAFVILVREKQ